MNYRQLTGKTIRQGFEEFHKGFEEFHKENPHVYAAFEEQVLRAIAKERKKVSAKLIINWIRWNEFLQSSDANFKINDAFQSYYARHFVERHPEHADIFDFRKLRNEEEGPYMKVGENGQISFL